MAVGTAVNIRVRGDQFVGAHIMEVKIGQYRVRLNEFMDIYRTLIKRIDVSDLDPVRLSISFNM